MFGMLLTFSEKEIVIYDNILDTYDHAHIQQLIGNFPLGL